MDTDSLLLLLWREYSIRGGMVAAQNIFLRPSSLSLLENLEKQRPFYFVLVPDPPDGFRWKMLVFPDSGCENLTKIHCIEGAACP